MSLFHCVYLQIEMGTHVVSTTFTTFNDLELCRLLLRVGRLKYPAFLLQDHVLK